MKQIWLALLFPLTVGCGGPVFTTASAALDTPDDAAGDAVPKEGGVAPETGGPEAAPPEAGPEAAAGCPTVCVSQTCVNGGCTGVCVAGQSACAGNGVMTCQADGTWGPAVVCMNKTCIADLTSASCTGSCSPNQYQCAGNAVQNCGPDGSWQYQEYCTGATPKCSEGVCIATTVVDAGCPSGALDCNGTCVQPSDPNNCGACGTVCSVGHTCDLLPDTNNYACI